jgi:hypothetical protein
VPSLIDRVRVNKTQYSWTSTLFKIDNFPTRQIASVDYEQKRDIKIVYASKQDGTPMGWTSGKYLVPAFSIKMLREGADALTDYLSVKGLGSYGDAEWSFMAQLSEPVVGLLPITMRGAPCRIIGEKDAYEEGIDEVLTEYAIGCLFMKKNGKQLWSAQRSIGV